MDQFEGKTAVITGAASGIGKALAERFAQEKMQAVLPISPLHKKNRISKSMGKG